MTTHVNPTIDALRAAAATLPANSPAACAMRDAIIALGAVEEEREQERAGRIQAQEDREMFARDAASLAASRLDLVAKQNEKIFAAREVAREALRDGGRSAMLEALAKISDFRF